jgi:hypothetical protein
MNKGEVVMIYTAPVTRRLPCGEARLIEFLEDYGICEFWRIEYVDNGRMANVLIKKDDGADTAI